MMIVWTITKNPSDAVELQKLIGGPDNDIFVLRPHAVGQGWMTPLTWCVASPFLAELQQRLKDRGLTQLPRQPDDDPVIVEAWV